MKIALLSFEYPPETGFGGIGTYTWYQARALIKLGHEVHVLAGSKAPTTLTTTEHDGVQVHRYRAEDLVMKFAGLFGKCGCYWTRQRIENAWCMFRGLRQLQRTHRFDVVEMPECGAEGALITQFSRTRTIVRFHSPSQLIMPFYDVSRADIAMCSWIEQLAIRQATALTSCSAFLAAEVREKLGVGRHVEVIANGIDLPLFDREPVANLSERYGVPFGQVTILFAGRMERRKGIHLCAEIVETILGRHDVTLLFAGEDIFGYVRDTLEPALAGKTLRGTFKYLGKLDLQELRACARAVDIYLLPSLWENCPYACLEAMASGRAIVASDQGGIPELIEDGGNGLLAASGSAPAFVAKLETLVGDRRLRQTLGAAARQTTARKYLDTEVASASLAGYQSGAGAGSG